MVSGVRGQESGKKVRPIGKRVMKWLGRHEVGVGIAAGMAFVFAVLAGMAKDAREFVEKGKDGGTQVAEASEIATLSGYRRVEWLRGKGMTSASNRIWAGQVLALKTGVVQITYDSGTRVVLEGPAEYRVGTRVKGTKAQREKGFNSGYLKVGKLVARVEGKKAKGFIVETPSRTRVEDLGTEFGVEVREDGAAKFVVLRGAVDLVREESGETPGQRVRLVKNQRAFVAADRGTIERRGKVDARFVAVYRKWIDQEFTKAGLVMTADDYHVGDQDFYAGTLLSNDLINIGSATLLSTTVANYTATESALNPGTPDFVLNDGSNGGVTSGLNLSNGAAADADALFQVTYNLDLTTNTAGYDLTRIRSYTAAANNRTAQEYEVFVDFVGDGLGNFISLGTFSTLNHEAGNTNQSARMTLENDANSGVDAFASGVAAIRFDANKVDNYPAWREFDVEGSATPPTDN